ncbi:MAG: hypothetical protein WCD68_09880, partial [Candidatus Acidiferrum sp.]
IAPKRCHRLNVFRDVHGRASHRHHSTFKGAANMFWPLHAISFSRAKMEMSARRHILDTLPCR